MDEHTDQYQRIVKELNHKAGEKQEIYKQTLNGYKMIKEELYAFSEALQKDVCEKNPSVVVSYKEKGDFETHIKFGGDTLIFLMHTNVFNFPQDHYAHKTDYVKEDNMRSYCGMILVYNFLSDSIKYNRVNDTGTLISRIFINKEGKFLIQGKKQFSFIFKEFSENNISKDNIKAIVQTSVLHAIDFDLLVPPVEMVQEITLMQKLQDTGLLSIKTGKKLGFESSADKEDIDIS